MSAPAIVFVDTETTGLHPHDHEIWEVAAIRYDPIIREVLEVGIWQLGIDIRKADPVALDMNGFHTRRWVRSQFTSTAVFARQFADFCEGAHLCGAVPSFDDKRLERLMLAERVTPTWHYHIIDVEALAIGYLNGRHAGQQGWTLAELHPVATSIPWSSSQLNEALGLNIPDEWKHTAEGDARWALAIWETCVPRIIPVASKDAQEDQAREESPSGSGGGCGGRIGPNG